MQINTKSIKSRFEKSMDKYDENAIVQLELAEKLVDELKNIRTKYDTILELGSGTGILTRQIKNTLLFKTYFANDLVEKSKIYTSKIIPSSEFIHGNALKIKPPKCADLIVSNAMFQWFDNIQKIADKCKSLLTDNGIIAFSTFGRNNFTEISDISGLTLSYSTTEEIIDILDKDFDILYKEEYLKVINFKTPLELLAHMKNTGVNSLSAKPWTVKDVKAFCEGYLEKFDDVNLTYNPIIVIAKLK